MTEVIENKTISKAQYSKENLVENLLEFRGRFRRFPTRKDFEEKRILPSHTTYYKVFGSLEKAIEEAEEARKPKERKPQQFTKKQWGFPCSFCGSKQPRGTSNEYYERMSRVISSKFMALLKHTKGETYFEAVLDCIYEVFGERCTLMNEELKQDGYLERFVERHKNKRTDAQCLYCGDYKTGDDNYRSSMKRILSMRFLRLLNSAKDEEEGYYSGVLDCIHSVFCSENKTMQGMLVKEGFDDLFYERSK